MPDTPRHEKKRLDPSLNLTLEGSLSDLPAAVGNTEETREREQKQVPERRLLGAPLENTIEGIHDTHPKSKPESHTKEVPRRIQTTREVSREEAIASTQQFFAAVDERNRNISTGRATGISTKVCERDITEVPNMSTSTAATTPVILDVEPIGTSSPRISLPEGSPSHPAVMATCRPRTWMQQITEGQTNEPAREEDSDESNPSEINVTPKEIPDELGHEWRVLDPFELPGVRFPMDSTPPNQKEVS